MSKNTEWYFPHAPKPAEWRVALPVLCQSCLIVQMNPSTKKTYAPCMEGQNQDLPPKKILDSPKSS